MKTIWLTEEVLKMRFRDIYGQYEKNKLTCEEAAVILGISISSFYRKRQIYEEEGDGCIFDRRTGRASPHKAADSEVEFVTKLFADRYRSFSVKHFYDFAKREHNISRSYNWVKNKLVETGLIEKNNGVLWKNSQKLGFQREDAGIQRYNVGIDTPRLWATSLGSVPDANNCFSVSFLVGEN